MKAQSRVRLPSKWPHRVTEGSSSVTIYEIKAVNTVRYQLRWNESGETKRRTLTDPKLAIAAAKKIAERLNSGEHATLLLSAIEAEEYQQWKTTCGNTPVSAAVNEWARATKALGGIPIGDAVAYYNARHQGADLLVEVAVDKFAEALLKKGRSEHYRDRLKSRLRRIKEGFAGKSIRSVTDQDVKALIDAWGGSDRTRKNMRDAIVTVWRWARDEGYLPRDLQTEAERVKSPKIRRKSSIGIFTPEEIKAILVAAPPHVRPAIAICAFAGVRSQGEISRLQWEHFRWDQGVIDVDTVVDGDGESEAVSKTGDRRLVPIHANLLEWLKGFKDSAGPVATLVKPDEAYRRAAKAAGISWRHNGLRHSYGSYRVAQTKSIDQTSLEMGNSPAMIKKHYLEAVHEDEAAKWFAVVP